jgi:pimeloyl-ACP methyl ester carboxylesterase
MQRTAKAIEEGGRGALEAIPVHPSRARRLPDEVKAALVADCAHHDPLGIARTALHTVPDSSVRERFAETRVPTLLVVGEREQSFAAHRRFAESALPGLSVVALDAGHAVNAEAATGFDAAVTTFLARA